jgi:hypothetical protein
MSYEYYFSESVNLETTWEHFIEHEHNKTLEQHYERITGYGWKASFAFKPDGKALYIDDKGQKYAGVWFESRDQRRIAVFFRK